MRTPPEVARRYRVKPDTVIDWIKSGELRAIDVSRPGSQRPRFRIDPADLVAFENKRLAKPQSAPKARRRAKDPQVIEFF
jgi:hypothetical protein